MSKRRPKERRDRSQRGFTLVEVMVSILLSAVATSGIIGLYIVETRASGFSRHQTEATILAQDQMEVLRTSKVTGGGSTAGINESGKVVSGALYTRSFTVTQTTAGYDDMSVSVSWDEDGNPEVITIRSRRNQ